MNPNGKLLVCLYSDPNFLAVNILENLLSSGCLVNIVTKDINTWNDRTNKLVAKNKFAFSRPEDVNKDQFYSYVIFCGGFLDKEKIAEDYKKFVSLVNLEKQKSFIILPFEIYSDNPGPINIFENSAAIYLGDLLGPRIDLESDLLLPTSINEILSERKLSVSIGEIFYPMFVPDVVRTIVKWMFAFGPYGKETVLLGNETSSALFWEKNKKLVGEIKLQYSNKTKPRTLPKGVEVQRMATNLDFCLKETYKWLSQELLAKPKKLIKKRQQTQRKKTRIFSKKTKTILIVILSILIIPLITLFIDFGLSFIAFKEFTSGKNSEVVNTLEIAQTFAVVGDKESGVLGHVPLLGKIYKETGYVSDVSAKLSKTGEDATPVIDGVAKLFANILGSSPYDPQPLLINTKTGLQNIYTDVSGIQELTKSEAGKGTVSAKMVLSKIDFEKYKKLTLQGEMLIDRTPNLLGVGSSKTYLVLFENNMELRPTGGFIGSYGLLTFDSGRLSDFTVSDVYSADGQLNGHVEPPTPIKEYLGEANWWLRDSNWDPDFPTSAKRAEWFLDKEIGKDVDGVFSIDLAPVRDILKLTGPIFLPDYNLNINSDNLYEQTESESQDNSFPGAHNKASFLTALSRSLLGEVGGLNSQEKIGLISIFYKNLEERHLQIFLHDGMSQNAVESLGWDGSVNIPSCGDNCYPDFIGIVEANLGVNKANYFIKRDMTVKVNVNQNEVERTLTLDLNNSANPALGVAGEYKNYMRLLVPEDATDFSIQSISGQNTENLSLDVVDTQGRKEVGTLVDILPGQAKKIVFSWDSGINTSNISSYGLYIRKQAGVDGYPTGLELKFSNGLTASDSRFTLTNAGTYVYNTTLSNDVFAHFSF